jgi:hypothetical protein
MFVKIQFFFLSFFILLTFSQALGEKSSAQIPDEPEYFMFKMMNSHTKEQAFDTYTYSYTKRTCRESLSFGHNGKIYTKSWDGEGKGSDLISSLNCLGYMNLQNKLYLTQNRNKSSQITKFFLRYKHRGKTYIKNFVIFDIDKLTENPANKEAIALKLLQSECSACQYLQYMVSRKKKNAYQ